MGLIKRYLLKAHIAPFVFGTFTVMFLFLFQFLLKYIDKLLGKGLDNLVLIQLIVLHLPYMLVLAVPMGVLFATIMGFGSMSANHEITIIKSSGGSLIKMMMPMVFIGILLSFFMFWFNDDVLPEANHIGKMLMNDITRKKPTFALDKGQFSTQIEGLTILAREIDSTNGAMKNVTIYDNTKPRLKNIINADSGFVMFDEVSSKMILNLSRGEIIQYVNHSVNNLKTIDFDFYSIAVKAVGFTLEKTKDDNDRSDREMRISDMQKEIDQAQKMKSVSTTRIDKELNDNLNYITCAAFPEARINNQNDELIQSSGKLAGLLSLRNKPNVNNSIKRDSTIDALTSSENRISMLRSILYSDFQLVKMNELTEKKYGVEIQKKYAIPVACLIFVLVGCPLGIRTKGGNFGLSAAFSLGFFILYWACLIGGEKLADRAVISPFLGMWMGNIIVGTLGIILTIKENNENLNFKTSFAKIFFKY